MLKKILSLSNLIFLVIVGVFVANQAPTIANNFQSEGKSLGSLELKKIGKNGETGSVNFPPKGRAIALFWSTTCGPCKVEMARLKASVEEGKIPKHSLYALNPFENSEEIAVFLKKNKYPFTFLIDPGLGKALDIRATPTTLFLENGKVLSMKSGMSLTGTWSAENFLK